MKSTIIRGVIVKHSSEAWDRASEKQFEKNVKSSSDLTVQLLHRILIEIQSIKEVVEKLEADIQSEPND